MSIKHRTYHPRVPVNNGDVELLKVTVIDKDISSVDVSAILTSGVSSMFVSFSQKKIHSVFG